MDAPRSRSRERATLPLNLAMVGLTLMGFNLIGLSFLPISDLVFFVLAGVIGLLLLTGKVSALAPGTARRSSPRLLLATVVLLVMAAVSSLRSWYPLASIGVVLRLIYLTLLLFWILRCLGVNRRAIDWLVRAWRWGVLISAAGAIVADLGLITLGAVNAEGRQSAWFGHPNDLAGYLTVAVPIFALGAPRAVTSRGRHAALRWVLTLGLVFYAVATTGSMSALTAIAAGIAAGTGALLLTRRSTGRGVIHPLKVMAALLVVAVALTALFGSDAAVVERLTRFEEGDASIEASVGTRSTLNERVISQFDELLLAGNGLDLRAQDELRGTDAGIHNMYIKMLYEAGLVAAVALVFFLIASLQMCWRLMVNMRRTPVHPDLAAVFGSCVAAMTFAMFQPTMFHRYFWLPFGLVQCYWAMRRSELNAQSSATARNAPTAVGDRTATTRRLGTHV